MNEPTLLLADEPTGALDSAGATEVLELFRRLHSGGQTILLVTHDERVAEAAERVVSMRDGRIHDGASEPSLQRQGRSVPAVRMRLRAELRARWRAWLALAVLAGLGAGLVIATAAGARRTDDAVARYRVGAEVFDVWVGKNEMSAAAFARVEKLPQVARAIRSVDVAFWGRNDAGRAVTVNDAELNAPINGPDAGHERTKYLSGRPPDPARADEIYVGARAAEENDLQVGSTLRVRIATPRELGKFADTRGFRTGADPETTGTGPLITLRVVGVVAEVVPEDALAWMSLSRGFYEAYRERVGLWGELTAIRLKRGDGDLDSFRAGVERLAGGKQFGFYPYRSYTHEAPKLDRSPNAGSPGPCRAGRARRAGPRRAGARPPSRSRVERASAPAVARDDTPPALRLGHDAGCPCEPCGRCARLRHCRSPLTARPDRRRPMGRARPGSCPGCTTGRRGRRSDHRACVAGGVVPAWRASRTRPHDARRRSSAAVGFLARAGFPASGVSGVRMALEPGRGRTAVPVRSTLLAAIVGVAAVTATFTITESADHLLDTPRLYGHNWDAVSEWAPSRAIRMRLSPAYGRIVRSRS